MLSMRANLLGRISKQCYPYYRKCPTSAWLWMCYPMVVSRPLGHDASHTYYLSVSKPESYSMDDELISQPDQLISCSTNITSYHPTG
jgi:hypothetical protein